MTETERKHRYLVAIGIEPAIARHMLASSPAAPISSADAAASEPAASSRAATPSPAERLAAIAREAADCQRCPLHETRTQVVFGVGDPQPKVVVIGEAPGRDEDRQGEPFVGRAGKLLDKMLDAIGLSRSRGVYIMNVLKCRPPNNRNPQPDEIAACAHWREAQLAALDPKAYLLLGRFAAQTMLETQAPVGALRGTVHEVRGRPAVVSWHPAYLLRQPGQKRSAWEDLQRLAALIEADA